MYHSAHGLYYCNYYIVIKVVVNWHTDFHADINIDEGHGYGIGKNT